MNALALCCIAFPYFRQMIIPKSHQDYKAAQISTANSVAILLSGALLGPRFSGVSPTDCLSILRSSEDLENQEAYTYTRKMQKGRNIQNFWDTQSCFIQWLSHHNLKIPNQSGSNH